MKKEKKMYKKKENAPAVERAAVGPPGQEDLDRGDVALCRGDMKRGPLVVVPGVQPRPGRRGVEPERLEVVLEDGRAEQAAEVAVGDPELPALAPGHGDQVVDDVAVLCLDGLEQRGRTPECRGRGSGGGGGVSFFPFSFFLSFSLSLAKKKKKGTEKRTICPSLPGRPGPSRRAS